MKICGLAVFKKDSFVGELSSYQSLYYLILSNQFSNSVVNIPSPFNDVEYISINISKAKSNNRVKIVNGSPYINCNINLTTRVLSSSIASNYLTTENIKNIEDYANSYFKAHFLDFLYKTSIDYKSDIVGFGKYAVRNYKDLKEWESIDWLNNYANSFFDVNVDTHVISSYLILGNNISGN
ncbi:MAG: Ger(x)C family spore germination C-terminal domain-containing protein [Clostridia bacterium]|nr:Ger(x)C family spore germination C-terminal domain-containing protein [Clostridia bacterium]